MVGADAGSAAPDCEAGSQLVSAAVGRARRAAASGGGCGSRQLAGRPGGGRHLGSTVHGRASMRAPQPPLLSQHGGSGRQVPQLNVRPSLACLHTFFAFLSGIVRGPLSHPLLLSSACFCLWLVIASPFLWNGC